MQIDVTGKVALVTGGSRGIGLGIARRFCEAGGHVMLVSRSAENLDRGGGVLEGLARRRRLDRRARRAARRRPTPPSRRRSSDSARSTCSSTTPARTPTWGRSSGSTTSGCRRPTRSTRRASSPGRARRGRSGCRRTAGRSSTSRRSAGSVPSPGIGWYNATKAAVIHLTRQLAFELAPTVRVNGIAPGLVRTELARGLWEGNEERDRDGTSRCGRIGEVDDVAPIGALPGLRRRVVDHRPDRRGRRRDDDSVVRRGRAESSSRRATLPDGGAREGVDDHDAPSAPPTAAASRSTCSRSVARASAGRRAGRPRRRRARPTGRRGGATRRPRRPTGAWRATRSTSAGQTFSPPVLITSASRPNTSTTPSTIRPRVPGGEPPV